jgi:hypothetical protein
MQALAEIDPARDTYEAVEQLINKIANRFARVYGGEFDEWKAQANLAYVPAYRSYQSGHGMKFSSYIATCIYRRLKYRADLQFRSVTTTSLSMKDGSQRPVEASKELSYDVAALLGKLSEDAKAIVSVVLDSPADLKDAVIVPGATGWNNQKAVRSYMKSLGWGRNKIAACMSEIKEALL